MTIYNVHLYREMRLKFDGIEADSPEAAAAITRNKATSDAGSIEDCEGENLAALVDVAGDDEFRQSVTIGFEAERVRKAASRMLASLEAILPYAESEAYSLEKLKDSPEAEAEAQAAWKALEVAQDVIADAKDAGIPPAAKTPARFVFTHEPEEEPDRAYVLVDGRFDVKIVRTAEGIVIDAYYGDGIEIAGTMTVWDDEQAEPEPSEAAQPVIAEAAAGAMPPSPEIDIHAQLAVKRQIADVWSILDVQALRPGLSDEQAWEVLQRARRNYDAGTGINWDVLALHADEIAAAAPTSDEA